MICVRYACTISYGRSSAYIIPLLLQKSHLRNSSSLGKRTYLHTDYRQFQVQEKIKEAEPEVMKEKVKAAGFHNHYEQMVSKMEFDPVSLTVSVHLLLSKVIHQCISLLQTQHSWLIRSYSVQEQSKQAAASSAQCLIHARLLKLSHFRCFSYFQCHQPLPALLGVFA